MSDHHQRFQLLTSNCYPFTSGWANCNHVAALLFKIDFCWQHGHYTDVIMTTIASQITSLTVVYSTVYSDADQRKHKSSASLAFVWGIHRDRWIPRMHKGPVTRKMFPFHDVIMICEKGSHITTLCVDSRWQIGFDSATESERYGNCEAWSRQTKWVQLKTWSCVVNILLSIIITLPIATLY